MPHTKSFMCLANSRKLSGRCVAGVVTDGSNIGSWVRPISARPTHEISEEERRYADGTTPKLLDVISVEFTASQPYGHQTENELIDPNYYWAKVGGATWDQAAALATNPTTLWGNGDSSYSGENDRITANVAANQTNSLVLIRVPRVEIRVRAEGAAFGNNKKRVRATFIHRDRRYSLILTDPIIEDEHLRKGEGHFTIEVESLLCISLAEVYEGYAYKLVAALIPKP